MLVPTTCFNCESACGLLAYVDKSDLSIRKVEGNPAHPGSRGRNCAKGPATINQIDDPERILHPLRRTGARGAGQWEQVIVGRGARRHRRPDPQGHLRGPAQRGDVPRRPARRGRLRRAVPARLGRRRAQLHTNVCSAGARLGYSLWGGYDRPSPDYANAKVILLLSSHLETGHYFNPHAQRIMEAKGHGAKLVVLDPRLSNTASHADLWVTPWPGSEAAILLAVAAHLLSTGTVRPRRSCAAGSTGDGPTSRCCHPVATVTDADLRHLLRAADEPTTRRYTFEFAAEEAQVPVEQIARDRRAGGRRRTAGSPRTCGARPRPATSAAGRSPGRCCSCVVLTGSVGTEGGTSPNGWDKFIPHGPNMPGGHDRWNELTWPREYPLATNEMSILLPHFLHEGRGTLDVYFSRVYNPIWTNPDGFAWMEALTDESQGRLPRRADADLVGDGRVRRLRAPDGPRDRAARHPLLRDARRQVARLPAAGAPGRHGEAGDPVHRHPRRQPGRGLGGERVLVRAVVADRPGRIAGHPAVLRVAVRPGREDDGRRVLPLRLREQRARPAGEGGGAGADRRWSTCASTASSRSPGTSTGSTSGVLTDAELARGDGRRRGRAAQAGHPGHPGPRWSARPARSGSCTRTARATQGWLTPSRKLEIYSTTMRGLGLARARDPRLHRVPRVAPAGRHRGRRVRADPDLPAADDDPHPVGQREVPQRDQQLPPAVAQRRRRRPATVSPPATWSG